MDTSRIALNIKYFRNLFHMKQKDLGKKIGKSRSTIAAYETGQNIPDIQTIQLIADCFNIPVEQLLMSTDELKDRGYTTKNFLAKDDTIINFVVDDMFPIACSDTAVQDELFLIAYREHQKIRSAMKNKKPYDDLSIPYDKYLESWNKNKTIESLANMLCIILMVCSTDYVDSRLQNMSTSIVQKGFANGKTLRDFYLKDIGDSDKENEILVAKREFYSSNQSNYVLMMRSLSKSDEWRELADYYSALRYVVGFVDNEYGTALNNLIFNELLSSYAERGNKYATNYIEKQKAFFS